MPCSADGQCLQGYWTVLIEDYTPDTSHSTPGADIEAVSLLGPDVAVKSWAETVEGSNIEMGDHDDNEQMDPSHVLGPTQGCDTEVATSLGGVGGWLVVSFGAIPIVPGDTVVVYEVGDCELSEGGVARAEPFSVSVSVDATDYYGGDWVLLGQCAGGECSFPVPDLP